jgi:hypothetical protein
MAAFSKRELREARCGDDLVADVSGLNVGRLQNSGESSARCGGPGSLQAFPLDHRARARQCHESRSVSVSVTPATAVKRSPTTHARRIGTLGFALASQEINQLSGQRALFRGGGPPPRQHPVWPRKVTGVAVRIALEVILVLRFRLPERADRRDFGHHLAWP